MQQQSNTPTETLNYFEVFVLPFSSTFCIEMAGKMSGAIEDAPRSMREIVQKKFLDEVIGIAGGLFLEPLCFMFTSYLS